MQKCFGKQEFCKIFIPMRVGILTLMVLQTWPDHGTPEEADGVLTFIDDINRKMYQIAQSNNAPEQVETIKGEANS